MKITNLRTCLLVSLLIIGLQTQAKVVLPSVFSDNMVFQQKTKAAIWGKADAGKTVSIATSWNSKTYQVTATADGGWKVFAATPEYGGPFTVTISDGEEVTLKNVMIGEVWLCSGQSNMEFPVAGWSQVVNYKQEVTDAMYPNIRLLTVDHVESTVPLAEAKIKGGGWQPCTPETVTGFSAVAYFFAKEVYKKTGMPVGLIHSSWGGTIVEAWESEGTVKQFADLSPALDKVKTLDKEQSQALYSKEINAWQKAVKDKDPGYKNGVAVWAATNVDTGGWQPMIVPSFWEKNELEEFDGVVWLRRKINIPAEWVGKDLQLNLGGVDDNDITFFNGEKVGESNGFNVMRNYTIPAGKVKAGENILTVRIVDGGGEGGIYGDKNKMFLATTSGERIALDGGWQYKVAVDFKDTPMPALNAGPNRPTVLFNGMINPLVQFTIRGVLWYQGESNVSRAHQYRQLFPGLINDWRQKFNNKNMPFYFVQLANYLKLSQQPKPSAWAELRDVQLKTLSLPNTGMAVTIDIGDGNDIHPKNKQDVGKRLALIALAKNYGEDVPYSGPSYNSYKVEGASISLAFKNVSGGLKAKDGGKLTGFTIAGADQKFYSAEAVISGDKIMVSSASVPKPVAVRYAWANNPVFNLYNNADLPASPFRTDDWQDYTFYRK